MAWIYRKLSRKRTCTGGAFIKPRKVILFRCRKDSNGKITKERIN